MDINQITEKIIGCCFDVHKELGCGYCEKLYHSALKLALLQHKLFIESEKSFHVFYHGYNIGQFRVDYIVEKKVIVELKAVTGHLPVIFRSQLISYLKASGLSVGLLVNFGNPSCQIRRYIY